MGSTSRDGHASRVRRCGWRMPTVLTTLGSGPDGAARPTMMAAGVAGSSASGQVMRTTALANSSESPTSRPTMKSDNERQAAADHRDADEPTRCAIGEPLPGAFEFRERRRDEPRRTDADSDQHPRPSVLLRRAQTPRVKKLVEAYKSIARLRRKGRSFSLHLSVVVPRETPMRRYPPPVRWRHGDGDDSDARLRGSGRARNRASAL
jgi:hypothetical protein